MEHIAAFVNDEAHARRIVEPLLATEVAAHPWTVVLCPPQMTHRIGKWLSERQRRHWRQKWSKDLQAKLEPMFGAVPHDRLEWVCASSRMTQTTAALRKRHGAALRIVDLRRRQVGDHLPGVEPASANQQEQWKTPVAVSSTLSMVLALVD